jgi:hypothetical protein
MEMNVLKQCCTCHEWKMPGLEFYNNKSRADGYSQCCKECAKAHTKKQRARLKAKDLADPVKAKERQKRLYANRLKNNRELRSIQNVKSKQWRDGFKANNPEEWSRRQCFYQRKRTYGISEAEFHDLLDSQNGCCACCGNHIKEFRGKHGPQVDHCHDTGRVRAILCHPCNVAEGYMKTPARAWKLFNYMADNVQKLATK